VPRLPVPTFVNLKYWVIFNGGFEVQKSARNVGKCARFGQNFRAFTMFALTMIAALAKRTVYLGQFPR
jgi:hypothetical protein